jgi:hypothetical protein
MEQFVAREAVPAGGSPSIFNRLVPHFDLVLNIAEILTVSKAFATLGSLSVVNRAYYDTLEPCLKKLKKKIVLDISDLRWLPQERYKDIQYVLIIVLLMTRRTLAHNTRSTNHIPLQDR